MLLTEQSAVHYREQQRKRNPGLKGKQLRHRKCEVIMYQLTEIFKAEMERKRSGMQGKII
jgi:hypothetical protein